jgi:hypothetical protein
LYLFAAAPASSISVSVYRLAWRLLESVGEYRNTLLEDLSGIQMDPPMGGYEESKTKNAEKDP